MSTQLPSDPHQQKIPRVEVVWTAVTYKTVAVYAGLLTAVLLAGMYLLVPDWYSAAYRKLTNAMGSSEGEAAPMEKKQARFVNLDGKVQIKKVNSVEWVDADYRTTLDKGDQVKTSAEGAARIAFADGTTYTVKSDSFVTVEENSTEHDRPTSVAMRVTSGALDLATPNLAPGSLAVVSVDDAKAQARQNSRMSVKNDPTKNEHEIVVAQGSAEVQRGSEHIELAQWEKASFATGGAIQKSTVLAPPDLVEPLNLQPLIVADPKAAAVHFEWRAVPDAVSYTLRISTSTVFAKYVEKKVTGTSTEVSGLEAGEYFWNVTAMDVRKRTSEVSDTFKFSLVAQGKTQEMVLEVDGTQLHGRVVEIIGRTEPGAALIVNGQAVSMIGPDGKFRHFTEQLQPGQQTIVITGQNRRGGTAILRVPIVIPK
ncbi:MAG: FecR domain-containing protein [Acidobacteriia bacterium]|nr:FecR domain-containing protein [Terriglobia bacterium]